MPRAAIAASAAGASRTPVAYAGIAERVEVERARGGGHDERPHALWVAQRVLEAGPAAHGLPDQRYVAEIERLEQRGEVIGIRVRRRAPGHAGRGRETAVREHHAGMRWREV